MKASHVVRKLSTLLVILVGLGVALPVENLNNPCHANPSLEQMYFTDATNCSIYYLCDARHLVAELTCPEFQAFDSADAVCINRTEAHQLCGTTLPTNPCSSMKQNVTYITSRTDCPTFLICKKNKHVASGRCQEGLNFNDQLEVPACVLEGSELDICPTTSIKSTPTTTTKIEPKSTPWQPTQPSINPCTETKRGLYYVTNPLNCNEYFICVGTTYHGTNRCDVNQTFNDQVNVCAMKGKAPRQTTTADTNTTPSTTNVETTTIVTTTLLQPDPCANATTNLTHITVPTDCNRFYICKWDKLVATSHCQQGANFNDQLEIPACVLEGSHLDICRTSHSTTDFPGITADLSTSDSDTTDNMPTFTTEANVDATQNSINNTSEMVTETTVKNTPEPVTVTTVKNTPEPVTVTSVKNTPEPVTVTSVKNTPEPVTVTTVANSTETVTDAPETNTNTTESVEDTTETFTDKAETVSNNEGVVTNSTETVPDTTDSSPTTTSSSFNGNTNLATDHPCHNKASGKMPHPQNCAWYYDCSAISPLYMTGTNLHECEYPQLFDNETLQCRNYDKVTCGSRTELKNPCDYTKMNTPIKSHRIPCLVAHGDCNGLPNGFNAWKMKGESSSYVECDGGRPISERQCDGVQAGQIRMIFDSIQRACIYRLIQK